MDWTHRLRLRNLKMLLSLAQTRNISHSAAMLNTTQPGLSKWLKDLEDDIGLPLFERHARGLRPTPHGDVLTPALVGLPVIVWYRRARAGAPTFRGGRRS